MKQFFSTWLIWGLVSTSSAFLVNASASQEQNLSVSNAEIKINMQDGDIRTFIQWIAERTNKNFVIDPRVKGKVSVISQESLTAEEAYQVFLSVLQVHGYTALESGQVVKIIPDASARHNGVPLMEGQNHSGSDEMIVKVIKPKNIPAIKLVSMLRPLVPQTGHLIAYPDSNALIVSDRAGNIEQISKIITRIDKAGALDIEIVPLAHANAKDVVTILKALMPKGASPQSKAFAIDFAADERSNSILMSGDAVKRRKLREIIHRLDNSESSAGDTQVFYLNYAKAKDVAPILQKMSGSIKKEGKDVGMANAEVSIEPDESTNALVVTAPPTLMKTIQHVVKKLDIRRAQVHVEALIVSVKEDVTNEVGVDWSTSDSAIGKDGAFARTHTTGNFGGSQFSQNKDGKLDIGKGFTFGFFRNGSLRSLIKAFKSDESVNVLSKPNIITLDNKEAEINVGQNIPVIKGQETNSSSTTSNPFTTFDREDVGIILKLTPRINPGNNITLEISQEISDVSETVANQAKDVVIDKRTISTNVLVEDKAILVIGGLIEDKVEDVQTKVPLLGDIPVIGYLFRNTKKVVNKTNLMVFLKPTILRDKSSGDNVTSTRYRFIKDRQKELRNIFDEIYSDIAPSEYNKQATVKPLLRQSF
ncbi:type II secretion system secretin GspD [Zooshikella ganghwensis]|uniref:Type II secretion system protein GspD n=1 Tax=Zooshikella ganghwensis TaxID=202772 RepID=A0A4P9VJQ9_9GAMM|nr:type II secretion system secretin GspD [Zooshikella ganghwensis]RDH43515.1 type II secretion system protein GspD [Zooshikella ganghwensis]